MKIGNATWVGTGSGFNVQDALFTSGTPVAVLVHGIGQNPVLWISGMTGSVPFTAAIASGMNTNGVTAGVAGGQFTIGTDASVNNNGSTYFAEIYYTDTDNCLNVGTYTGNATGSRAITTTDAQRWDMVITVPSGANSDVCVWKTTEMGSNNSQNLASTISTTLITALGTGSFTIGAANSVNRSGEVFYYLVLRKVTGIFATFTYAGTGGVQTVPSSSFGFTPISARVKGNQGAVGLARWVAETTTHSLIQNTASEVTNGITAYAAGGITLGAGTNCNNNATTYYGVAVGKLGTVIATATTTTNFNTTTTNDMSPDGFTWADVNAFVVDKFNNLVILAQRNNGGSKYNVFVFSSDGGATWTDNSLHESFLDRGSIAYDSVNDIFHVLWNAVASTDGIIYRRYLPTRDGSNNLSSLARDAGPINLQLDFQTANTVGYDFPKLAWLNDAAYGTYGALVAFWVAAELGGGTTGTEYRGSMVVMGSTATQGGTAGNWAFLVTASTTTITQAPAVAYTAIATSTTPIPGSLAYTRVIAGTNVKDIYFAYYDPTPSSAWRFKRLKWSSGSNNWSTGLTSATSLSATTIAGSDTGYSLKYQLITQMNEDTVNDLVVVGAPLWLSNTLGDTQIYWSINKSTDTPSASNIIYSANGASGYAPTMDLSIDQLTSNIFVTYVSGVAPDANYAYYTIWNQGVQKQGNTLIYSTHGIDIPLMLTGRFTFGGKQYMVGAFRDTLNTPTPPYVGTFYQIAFPVSSGSLLLLMGGN